MQKDQIEKYDFLKDEPKKLQFDIFDLAEYQKNYSDDSSRPHTHSFYQIIWFKIVVANIILILKVMISKRIGYFLLLKIKYTILKTALIMMAA